MLPGAVGLRKVLLAARGHIGWGGVVVAEGQIRRLEAWVPSIWIGVGLREDGQDGGKEGGKFFRPLEAGLETD